MSTFGLGALPVLHIASFNTPVANAVGYIIFSALN